MNYIEEREQNIIFHWAKLQYKKYPMLRFLHSSTAGVRFKNAITASRAKKSGMPKGLPDIFLPYPNNGLSGLYIELKRQKIGSKISKGTLTKEQKEWLEYLNKVGYKAIVCYGAQEGIKAIKDYLGIKE